MIPKWVLLVRLNTKLKDIGYALEEGHPAHADLATARDLLEQLLDQER